MRRFVAAMGLGLMAGPSAFADSPPSHHMITPLNKADVNLYLSLMPPAAAYVRGAKERSRAIAQKAIWQKEDDVATANVAFLKAYAPEIVRLRKVLHDVMFVH